MESYPCNGLYSDTPLQPTSYYNMQQIALPTLRGPRHPFGSTAYAPNSQGFPCLTELEAELVAACGPDGPPVVPMMEDLELASGSLPAPSPLFQPPMWFAGYSATPQQAVGIPHSHLGMQAAQQQALLSDYGQIPGMPGMNIQQQFMPIGLLPPGLAQLPAPGAVFQPPMGYASYPADPRQLVGMPQPYQCMQAAQPGYGQMSLVPGMNMQQQFMPIEVPPPGPPQQAVGLAVGSCNQPQPRPALKRRADRKKHLTEEESKEDVESRLGASDLKGGKNDARGSRSGRTQMEYDRDRHIYRMRHQKETRARERAARKEGGEVAAGVKKPAKGRSKGSSPNRDYAAEEPRAATSTSTVLGDFQGQSLGQSFPPMPAAPRSSEAVASDLMEFPSLMGVEVEDRPFSPALSAIHASVARVSALNSGSAPASKAPGVPAASESPADSDGLCTLERAFLDGTMRAVLGMGHKDLGPTPDFV